MATNIESYFFHKDHNTLTVDDIRKHGFHAKEASNGFIEAYPSMHLLIAEKELELKRELKNKELEEIISFNFNKFLELLIDGVKESCAPIMLYSNNGDDTNKLTIFTTPKLVEIIEENPYSGETSSIANKIAEAYGFSNSSSKIQFFSNPYSKINFARHTEFDLVTEAQTKQLADYRKQLQDYHYNIWLKTFCELTERQKLKRLKDLMNNYTSSLFNTSSRDDYQEKLFIERYIAEE